MKKNVGTVDKILRVLVGVVLLLLIAFKALNGVAAIILGIIAVILILTSIAGFCPLYAACRLSTSKQESKKA